MNTTMVQDEVFLFVFGDRYPQLPGRTLARGALPGSSPDDAFSVHVGRGETMTAQDLLDRTLRVTVLVAIVRPAELIELTFQLQMHSR